MSEIRPPGVPGVPDDAGVPGVPDDAGGSSDAKRAFGAHGADPGPEVGHPRSPAVTAAMLSRYLVGRAIAARVSVVLLVGGLVILLGAVATWVWVSQVLAVLIGILGLCVLAFRAVLMRVLGALMGVGQFGAAEARIRGLVSDTGGDLRRELRRIGLPGSPFGLPVLFFRLLGRRRGATLTKLKEFNLANVVPKTRMDELNFVVRNDVLGR